MNFQIKMDHFEFTMGKKFRHILWYIHKDSTVSVKNGKVKGGMVHHIKWANGPWHAIICAYLI